MINPDKLVLLNKHSGDFKAAVPFHLKGYYTIDFSDDSKFEEAFTELLHRIYDVPFFETEPIGQRPTLVPKTSVAQGNGNTQPSDTFFLDILRPIVREYNDIDKMRFMGKSYKEIGGGKTLK